MTQARSVSATFSLNAYPLSLSAENGGGVSGAGNFAHGSLASITAIPDEGYVFTGWSGEGVTDANAPITTVSMTQARSVSALFSLKSYALNLSAGEGGSVTGTGSFVHGSLASITATPDVGYAFTGWSGEGVIDANAPNTTVSMTQARSVSATFSLNAYPLSLSAENGGGVSGAGNFAHGSFASITAIADEGYVFTGWSGKGVIDANAPNTTVSMTQARSISALFSLKSYALNISAGEGGSVTGTGSFVHGSLASITATPDEGYAFTGWSGEGVTDDNALSTTISMTEPRVVSATFSLNEYALVLTGGEGGSVTGTGSFVHGSLASITATPDEGYTFTGWSGEGVSNASASSTVVEMTAERSVLASFRLNSYPLLLSAGIGGQVSGTGNFSHGMIAPISATPEVGYGFSHWFGAGADDPHSSTTTVPMTEARTLSAIFSPNSYPLRLSAGEGGTVTGEGNFTHGMLSPIVASSYNGYSFSGWLGNGVSNPSAPFTTVHMNQARTVSATFSLNKYVLNLSAGEGGSVSGDGEFSHGSLVSVNAMPDIGYSFSRWAGEGVTDLDKPETTVSMTEARSVYAIFILNEYTLNLSSGEGGTVSGQGKYPYGSTVSINANPESGYSFSGWSGSGITDYLSESTIVGMNENISLFASFTLNSYSLNLSAGEGGSVSGGGQFAHGETALIHAFPDDGYFFSGWSGEGTEESDLSSTTVLMKQNRSLAATFSRYSYNLSIISDEGGSASGEGNFAHGHYAPINAFPLSGYAFSHWEGNGINELYSPSTTILIKESQEIQAHFIKKSSDKEILITVSSPNRGGSTMGAGSYELGAQVMISATPSPGFSFDRWEGEGVASVSSNVTSVSMDKDKNITAVFLTNTHTLVTNQTYGGTILGNGTYEYGEYAEIEAQPNSGYSFVRWTGNGIENPNSPITSVIMTNDRNITAVFLINSYQLEAIQSPGGTISGIGTFEYGSKASVLATPDSGFSFVQWNGDGFENSSMPYTNIEMTEDRNISATFSSNTYFLTIEASTGGIFSGTGTFEFGTEASISAYPDPGYSFVQWIGSGVLDPSSPNTTVDMTMNRNLYADFQINSHLLDVTSGNGGTSTGSGSYDYGTEAGIEAFPSEGYSFMNWSGHGIINVDSESTKVRMTEDRMVTAHFLIDSHSLLVESSSGGIASGSGIFPYGSEAPLVAYPENGHSFINWSGIGVSNPTAMRTTVKMTENREIQAHFSIDSYELKTSSTEGGSTSGSGIYEYATNVEILAFPNPGYSFSGWIGEGPVAPENTSTHIVMTEDRNLTASFAINSFEMQISESNGGYASGAGIFEYGTTAEVSAHPEVGYSFIGWEGSGVVNPTIPTTVVRMTQDRNIKPIFSQNSIYLSINASTGGTASGSGFFEYGSQVPIVAIPNSGYSFNMWDGEGVENPLSSTTTVILTNNLEITALFSNKGYRLSISSTKGGEAYGEGFFSSGASATILAIPSEGYSFIEWVGQNITDSNSRLSEITMLQDEEISAHFEKKNLSDVLQTQDHQNLWFSSQWFGSFMELDSGWCRHMDLGWIYPVSGNSSRVWFWHSNWGWLWTQESLSNPTGSYYWSDRENNWLYVNFYSYESPWAFNYQYSRWEPFSP